MANVSHNVQHSQLDVVHGAHTLPTASAEAEAEAEAGGLLRLHMPATSFCAGRVCSLLYYSLPPAANRTCTFIWPPKKHHGTKTVHCSPKQGRARQCAGVGTQDDTLVVDVRVVDTVVQPSSSFPLRHCCTPSHSLSSIHNTYARILQSVWHEVFATPKRQALPRLSTVCTALVR